MILCDEEKRKVIELRRDIHRHPEISFEETRTSERIREVLGGLSGVEILDFPVSTGVVAVLTGTRSGKESSRPEKNGKLIREIALRADIDAISQTEKTDVAWRSETPGVMHACGHDCHTAALLGAAMALSRCRGRFSGQVDFVFQPAEEITRGAEAMIGAGLFSSIHPDRMFGLHNWPTVPAGKIVVQEGPRMAAKINFRITIQGRGGHGSEPQNNIDPIVCAAAVVQSLQTIVSRNIDPMDNVICSVNSIRGGSEQNLVVDDVVMTATIRAIQQDALERAWERAGTILRSVSEAYSCGVEIVVEDRIPSVSNPPMLFEEAERIACEAAGRENVCQVPPALASEDFSFYMQEVPSWFFWVGSGAPGGNSAPLHSPQFCPEESVLAVSAELYAAAALCSLS
ncbi:MAG: M20 metallopeptidase family protein [Bilifractor sp.]|jgi:amidohydrolase